MTVYVDDMHLYPIGKFRRMKMSHLIADSEEELLAMVDKIGVQRKWHQYPGTPKSHFDICVSKRSLAIAAGAQEITMERTAEIVRARREAIRSVLVEVVDQATSLPN